jgi:hypothetical protein
VVGLCVIDSATRENEVHDGFIRKTNFEMPVIIQLDKYHYVYFQNAEDQDI